MRLAQPMQVRHTDRRPVSDEPVPADALRAIEKAVSVDARIQVLSADQVLELADMRYFGARANLAKALLYTINGGRDEVTGEQVGAPSPPRYTAGTTGNTRTAGGR